MADDENMSIFLHIEGAGIRGYRFIWMLFSNVSQKGRDHLTCQD